MKPGKYKIVPPPCDDAAIQRQYAVAASARQARRVVTGRGLPPEPELYFYKGDPENGLAWEWSGDQPAVWDILVATDAAGESFESVIQLPGTDRNYGWDGETAIDGVYQLVGRDAGGAAQFASKAVPKTPVKLGVYCDYGFAWYWPYKNPVQWEVYVTVDGVTALVGTVDGSERGLADINLVTGGEYHVIGTDGEGHMTVRPSEKQVSICVAPTLSPPVVLPDNRHGYLGWEWNHPNPAYWVVDYERYPGTARASTVPCDLTIQQTVVGINEFGRNVTLVGYCITIPPP